MSEPFRITSPLHGDVLNLHDGKETSDQLTVEVAGAAPQGAVPTMGNDEAMNIAAVVRRHDEGLHQVLRAQVTDPASRWCGAVPDQRGLYHCYSAAGLLREGAAAYYQPLSEFRGSGELHQRMALAADLRARTQGDDGNINLVTTNSNPPPDTGFVVHSVAAAATRPSTGSASRARSSALASSFPWSTRDAGTVTTSGRNSTAGTCNPSRIRACFRSGRRHGPTWRRDERRVRPAA